MEKCGTKCDESPEITLETSQTGTQSPLESVRKHIGSFLELVRFGTVQFDQSMNPRQGKS
jgi:hypothetical protein